jgi:hypothetical protein
MQMHSKYVLEHLRERLRWSLSYFKLMLVQCLIATDQHYQNNRKLWNHQSTLLKKR